MKRTLIYEEDGGASQLEEEGRPVLYTTSTSSDIRDKGASELTRIPLLDLSLVSSFSHTHIDREGKTSPSCWYVAGSGVVVAGIYHCIRVRCRVFIDDDASQLR